MPLPGPLMAIAWIVKKHAIKVGVGVGLSYYAAYKAGQMSNKDASDLTEHDKK